MPIKRLMIIGCWRMKKVTLNFEENEYKMLLDYMEWVKDLTGVESTRTQICKSLVMKGLQRNN